MNITDWSNNWSESKFAHIFPIKEPVNSLSSLAMALYIIKTLTRTVSIQNLLKFSIIFNLLSSFVAHATYNHTAIFLDGFSMIIPILLILIKYGNFLTVLFICGLLFYSFNYSFGFGLLIVIYILKDKIKHQEKFEKGIYSMIVAILCWILDTNFHNFWFLFGHAFWHVLMSIGILNFIESIQWDT